MRALQAQPASAPPRVPAAFLAVFLALGLLLALTPASAFAARTYDSQITGFQGPYAATVDPADNVWIADPQNSGLVSEYDGYPSQTLLGTQTGGGHFQGGGQGVQSLAVNGSTGYLDVSDNANLNVVDIFDNAGAFVKQFSNGFGNGQLRVAVDNSDGASQGRIYVAYNHVGPTQGGAVQAFNPAGSPLDFSASAGYIQANSIIGTPTGPFGDFGVRNLAVDSHGNIYVLDQVNKVIDEFDSTGTFIQAVTGAGVPGGFGSFISGVAVDPTNDNVLVVDSGNGVIDEFDSSGTYLGQLTGTGPSEATPFGSLSGGIAVNSSGYVYVVDPTNGVVDIFTPQIVLPKITYKPVTNLTPSSGTLSATIDPNGGGNVTACHFDYGTAITYSSGSIPCSPDPASSPPGSNFSAPTDVGADLTNLAAGTTYHYRVVVTDPNGTRKGPDRTLATPPAVAGVTTGSATAVTQNSATLGGSFIGDGNDTHFYFAYGTSANYGHTSPAPPGTDQGIATGTQNVSTPITGLISNATYHYALVATNKFGTTFGQDATFTTFQPPTIEAFSTSEVTATSAVLHAKIHPQGFSTTYRFQYGTTTDYGETAPEPEGEITGDAQELSESHSVKVEIANLTVGATYHFRVLAENKWDQGKPVTSEDQTFEFFPPGCPNAAVRQQTGSAYLPDCRAYELVSPGNAEATLLYPGGPNTGYATNPPRFSYTGAYSMLPGTNTINTAADLYVATRTVGGWVSRYVGLAGDQTGCMGGPPNDPRSNVALLNPPQLTNTVLTDPTMSRFLDWRDGAPINCVIGTNGIGDTNLYLDLPSNAPYLWNADGGLIGRLPTTLGDLSGAEAALQCPFTEDLISPRCTGDVTASADLSHLAFSSNQLAFAEGGVTAAPGSAYDNDLGTGSVALISRTPQGTDIPQDNFYAGTDPKAKAEFIRFPATSADGSHILMSTATATTPSCGLQLNGDALYPPCRRFVDTPVHLYMRVDDAVSYDVSVGQDHLNHAVSFVGMSTDGSKVYFTSTQQLVSEDTDTSADLYMWSERGAEAGQPLTLVSRAAPGSAAEAGNTDACEAALTQKPVVVARRLEEEENHLVKREAVPWTANCDVVPYSGNAYSWLPAGIGGNGVSDSAIASGNGDIYFYSPEQLDGDKGVLGEQNLYDYRNGEPQFVATLKPEERCDLAGTGASLQHVCSDGPVVRLNVTPDDSHAAFVTASRLTPYDNAGHLEMYSYTPSSGALACDSCRPDGQPPTGEVRASEDGRFLTEDGRVFFSTTDSLVPQDTNQGIDVYEFVGGRPELITPGTGTASASTGISIAAATELPGLVAVSADGTDVYFSTYDSLISEDHNGNFLKFYDARTGGGFTQPLSAPPCAAAEECHGPGTEAPELPIQGTAAELSGGNVSPKPQAKPHSKKHRRKSAKKRRGHRPRATGAKR